MARLGDVVKVEPSHDTMACEKQWLLNLDMVEQQTGRVLGMNYVDTDSLTGSIIHFDTSMVLYSKLRPNLNKVVLPMQAGYATSEMLPLKPNESVLSREYLTYYLRSDSFVTWAVSKTAGAKMPRLGTRDLLEKEIQLPSLCEQHLITQVFSKLDSLVQLEKQQLTKLDEIVKSRFVEMFGEPLINDMMWSEVTLDRLADVVSGITKGRKVRETELIEVPYMAVSNVKDGYIDWTTVKTILATRQEIEQYRLLPNDVLMTEGGDPDKLGRGAVITEPLENSIHQNHVFRVRLYQNKVLPVFFSEYLQHQKAKQYFLSCAKQTTGIASINMTQLRALPVLMPPLELQNQFAAFVAQVDKSKLAVKQSLDKLETLKKSLMQQYFG